MELRERIINAGINLFRDTGLQFTMQDLAASLSISKKTIYTVYSSKEDLLLDMVDKLFADIHKKKAELAAAPKPIEERIKSVIIALPEQYEALDLRMLDEAEEKYPAAAKRVREHLDANWEPTIALIEEGIAEGKIRPVSVHLLKQMIISTIESILSDRKKESDYAKNLEEMIDIIMNGIRLNKTE